MKFETYFHLAQGALRNDSDAIRVSILQAAAAEKSGGREKNGEMLEKLLRRYEDAVSLRDTYGLVRLSPDVSFSDLILTNDILSAASDVKIEREHADKLLQAGLFPRHSFLCKGSPGTGKTSFAIALASLLHLPLYTISWTSVINSHLGETGKALGKLLDFVTDMDCVLLLDEADIIIRERDDKMEIGEMKRVVCDFLPRLEKVGWNCVIVATTNHPQVLDTAVWRRFDFVLDFHEPNVPDLQKFARMFCEKHKVSVPANIPLCANYSEINAKFETALRRSIIFDADFATEFEKIAGGVKNG